MPARHEIIPSKKFVRIILWGVLTEFDIYELTSRIRNEPTFNPDMRCLIDLREVEHAEVSAEFLSVLAKFSILSGVGRRAVVVQPSAFEARLGSYLSRLNPETSKVFHQLSDALAFLNEGVEEGRRVD